MEELSNIWVDDVLGRREDATVIHRYLLQRFKTRPSERGFVLAINADWGVGKSFLLQRWRDQAEADGHPAVYFDAWENDFAESPLLAFISTLKESLSTYLKMLPGAEKFRRKAAAITRRVLKPAALILASTAAKHVTGLTLSQAASLLHPNQTESISLASEINQVGADVKNAGQKIADAVQKALDEHEGTKVAIRNLKSELDALIQHLESRAGVSLPLLVFVDELDRCRPNYAIELLEGIKHLFGVRGVYFVVATNTVQLGESIKAVYGAGFDSHRYLKRFFDLHYSLRDPSNAQFAAYLLKEVSLPDAMGMLTGLEQESVIPATNPNQPANLEIISFVLSKHADAFKLSLRDQQQVAVILEAALFALRERRVHIFFLVFLAVLYHRDSVIFENVQRTRNLGAQSGFDNVFKKSNLGLVKYTFYNNDGHPAHRGVSVAEIASVYLTNLEKDEPPGRHDLRDFPRNLVNGIQWKRDSTGVKGDHAGYFDLIRNAGGFRSSD